ncbi:hypothetical protein B7760_01775 [Burkholderia glumae]|uniref:NUMOD4 domain-containing protein n=1 Tax=Burkholderia glumae TaxID=337 RepID=UPI00157AFE9D|nr:NUMOD4 domain-containing protein [Burkholderia glumae]QKM47751.1 hypothetical protein B7760_01775 [Burkholderia glumae]
METWRDIPGFEGRYQVSDQGRVRSVDRRVRAVSKTGREYLRPVLGVVLRPGDCRGYPIVNLHPAGTIAVHLLVARAFVPGAAPGLEVNHLDGDKTNCCAANLEWVTKQQNQIHAVDSGLRSQAISVIDPLTGERYPSITRAARSAHKRVAHIAKNWRRA